jgi:hypothetical protein
MGMRQHELFIARFRGGACDEATSRRFLKCPTVQMPNPDRFDLAFGGVAE